MTTPEATPTPRPWKQTGTAKNPHWYISSPSGDVLVHGPRMDQTDMAPSTYARWIADAALIVEAVNNFDRLRKIERLARAALPEVMDAELGSVIEAEDVLASLRIIQAKADRWTALRAALDEESQP